ncbi:MAG: type II secretion system protein [Paraclostridium sp.]
MNSKVKNKKGFTLVELLVVIAIIGILAVVAVPALFKNIGKAKVADTTADYNTIKSATLSLYSEGNEFSTSQPLAHKNKLDEYMDKKLDISPIGGVYVTLPNKINDRDGNNYMEGFKPYKYNEETQKYEQVVLEENFEFAIRVMKGYTEVYKDEKVKITEDQFKQLSQNIGNNFVFVQDYTNFENGGNQEVILGIIPKK